ncbi:MAG TPA: hypothetical protein P5119_13365 [Candidatus Aminicenantes bacterium]|nr:hypothetical protein [Candidatus Aminicenantes bacterium]HRY66315.1 hypothetical protein [Candidatus Aminicenantes bacterium]HRZ73238.1 hypothetical protein [Candidatus Aminicenantes bacterium]
MKKTRFLFAAALAACLVFPAFGQILAQTQTQTQTQARPQIGGYLSLEYIKGQPESAYPHGAIENLLAGFLTAGQIGQKFGFAAEVQARGVDEFSLNQAWAGFLPSEAFTVRAGLYLVPFGQWNAASRPYETVLIRTPLNLEHLYPSSWRELGVLAHGRIGILTYDAYLGNGLAETSDAGATPYVQQFRDNNTDMAKGGRLGFAAGQAIQGGVSYYSGKYDDQNMRDLTLEGVDFSWVTAQWEVHGEYTKALIENPQPYPRGESEGWFVWMCMSFRGLQPVGSFQKVKMTDVYHNEGAGLDRKRWSAGLRYVLSQTLFIKLEYDWNTEKGTALKDNQWQVQLGLSF